MRIPNGGMRCSDWRASRPRPLRKAAAASRIISPICNPIRRRSIIFWARISPGLSASPQLEGFRARGIEVLLLPDPVDAFWVATAVGFDGKPFKSVTQGAADIKSIPLKEKSRRRGGRGRASGGKSRHPLRAYEASLGRIGRGCPRFRPAVVEPRLPRRVRSRA